MDTFLIQIMYRVVIHGTMQEDLLSHQRFLKHGPYDLFAFTLSPIEWLSPTRKYLFPESFIGGVHDTFVLQNPRALLGNGHNR